MPSKILELKLVKIFWLFYIFSNNDTEGNRNDLQS